MARAKPVFPASGHTEAVPAVRSATPSEADDLRAVLARAFVDDPIITWALPDPSHRLEHAEAWLGWFVDAYLADGIVDCVDHRAVALWLPPGQRAAIPPPAAPSLHEVLTRLVGHDHATRVLSGFATLGPRRPEEAHVYLHILGVDPSAQGQGLGGFVLGPLLLASEQTGVAVHLESANPRNHSFYERLGFERTGVEHLGDGAPTLTSFTRQPSRRLSA